MSNRMGKAIALALIATGLIQLAPMIPASVQFIAEIWHVTTSQRSK